MAAATVTQLQRRQAPRPRIDAAAVADGARMAILDYAMQGGALGLDPEVEEQLRALCACRAPFSSMLAALGVEPGCETPTELLAQLFRLAAVR